MREKIQQRDKGGKGTEINVYFKVKYDMGTNCTIEVSVWEDQLFVETLKKYCGNRASSMCNIMFFYTFVQVKHTKPWSHKNILFQVQVKKLW